MKRPISSMALVAPTPSSLELPTVPLASAERRELARYEEIIATKLVVFLEVGVALLRIKQQILYRERFTSFGNYCSQRWGFSRAHAYRLVGAAKIYDQMSPTGDICLPENERQIRPLSGLAPERAREAWTRAVVRAAGARVTGSMVREAVAEVGLQICPVNTEKQDWQVRVEPLLKQAREFALQGDKASCARLVHRISLLLLIGERPQKEEEQEK